MSRRLMLAISIGTLAGMVVGILLMQTTGRGCKEWQLEYGRVAEEGQGGVFAFINEGPTAERLRELEQERPPDCPIPR